jgi:hypothetical protein
MFSVSGWGAESVAGHLLKADSVFAFLAAHRAELFADEMFDDLFLSGWGRPSVPAEVMASPPGRWPNTAHRNPINLAHQLTRQPAVIATEPDHSPTTSQLRTQPPRGHHGTALFGAFLGTAGA